MLDVIIDNKIDKEPYSVKISDDKVINITGEGGSGKSTICAQYIGNPEYIVVDYDSVILDDKGVNSIEHEIREHLISIYGESIMKPTSLEETKESFTKMYQEILAYLSPLGKTIVLDGTQLRFINDVSKIKGQLIALRPSIETCVERSVKRNQEKNPNMSENQLKQYEDKRRAILYQLNPLLNDMLVMVAQKYDERYQTHPGFNYPSLDEIYSQEQIANLQSNLKVRAQNYLQYIMQEYGTYINADPSQIISQDIINIELNGNRLLETHKKEILSDNSSSQIDKQKELSQLSMPPAHGARTFDDKTIHVYPSFFLKSEKQLSIEELQKKCDNIVLHEILHYFIRPQYSDDKKVSALITEGLVDMCTRDILMKYGLNLEYSSNYSDNVIFLRDALSNVSDMKERYNLVFNGSVEQILSRTSTETFDSKMEAEKIVAYQSEKDETKKEKLKPEFREKISEIAYGFPSHQGSIERKMMDISANYSSKEEGLKAVSEIAKLQLNKAQKQSTQIQSESSPKEAKFTIFKKKKEERQIQQQNINVMAQQKQETYEQQKQMTKQHNLTKLMEKPKQKTLTKPTNSGYANIITLALIISFVAGALSMIVYNILK